MSDAELHLEDSEILEEDFFDEDGFDDESLENEEAPEALTGLGQAAERLKLALQQETHLARNGQLSDFAEAVEAKRAALQAFNLAIVEAQQDPSQCSEPDQAALRRLMATADENALILDAVRTTVTDLATRLRTALTSAADPGTYGPKGRGPRHAMAAQYDIKI